MDVQYRGGNVTVTGIPRSFLDSTIFTIMSMMEKFHGKRESLHNTISFDKRTQRGNIQFHLFNVESIEDLRKVDEFSEKLQTSLRERLAVTQAIQARRP